MTLPTQVSWASNGNAVWTAIAYDGTKYWVAVGASGALSYATDPSGTWTSNNQGASNFLAVAYGNGYWVAVGASGTLYYKATDPTGAWTSNTQGSSQFNGVAYGNGYWVAVGASGALWYRATDPTSTFTSNTQGSSTFQGVAYGNGYWVAVGASGALWYRATDPTSTFTSNTQGTTTFEGVAYGNGYWVAVGDSGTLRYRATDPTGAFTSNNQGTTTFLGAFYDGTTYWVAFGTSGVFYYKATDPTGAWTSNAQGFDLSGGTFGAGFYVLVSSTTSFGFYYGNDPRLRPLVKLTNFGVKNSTYWGPFLSSAGNVYVVTVSGVGSSTIHVVKATDPTNLFQEVDAAHIPAQVVNTSAAFFVLQDGDVLWLAVGAGATLAYKFHEFHMSTDLWDATVKDIAIASPTLPSTTLPEIVVTKRSDGSLAACFQGAQEKVSGTNHSRIQYSTSTNGSSWAAAAALSATGVTFDFGFCSAVLGASDRTHFFWGIGSPTSIFSRSLTGTSTLDTQQSVAFAHTQNGITGGGISYVSGASTLVKVLVIDSANNMYLVSLTSAANAALTLGASFNSTTTLLPFSIVKDGTTAYAVWIGNSTADLFHNYQPDGGSWSANVDDWPVPKTLTQGVSANIYTRNGNKVLAIVTNYGSWTGVYYNEFFIGGLVSPILQAVKRGAYR